MLNPDKFKRAIQSIDALGVTPAVLIKVAELANDPDTDLATISDLLRKDGSLVADIIRISNSPYYAPAELHGNLTSAVTQIGMREVIRVVQLSLSRQLFARDLPSYGITAYDYWSDSIATALVMEASAKHAGLNWEDAYTIGILHGIGRVLINRVIEEQGFTLYWDGHQPIEQWERSAVGFDSAAAGAMLLAHWLFPASTCELIRHQYGAESPGEAVSLLGSLKFSRRLVALTGVDFAREGWQFPDTDHFAQTCGLTPAIAVQIVSTCREDFQRILQSVDL